MAHPRWPGFITKTGSPPFDNRSRQLNQHMYRNTAKRIKVSCAGRKRKKQLKRVEGGNYIKLWASVMNGRIRKARESAVQ